MMKRKSEHRKRFTRRAFLKATAAAGVVGFAGRGPAGAQAPERPARWNREADVVVIGSGAAGLPAAIAARERGASLAWRFSSNTG